MSDVFVSYSSKDRERAALIARALEARGWNVWWDRTIPPGRQYDDVIEEALAEARCVVVLWSKASAASAWVKNEASEAVSKKALIPAVIEDEVKIPFEFRRVQAADLSRWQGDPAALEFRQFCDAIAAEVAAAAAAERTSPEPAARAASPPAAAAGSPVATFPAPPPIPAAVAAAAPPTSAKSKKPYVIGGIILFVLLGIASMVSEQQQQQAGTAPMPASPAGATPAVSGGGVHQHLVWRDYVLAYSGNVAWDGRSNTASIFVDVVDSQTRQPLGSRQLQAMVNPNGANQIVMSTSVAVPGDSRTPGPHSHNVNLVFQSTGDGDWSFVHNCMSPNDCY